MPHPFKCLLLYVLFNITQNANAQKNYLQYHDLINDAEKEFVQHNNKVACYRHYDTAFKKFEKPFLKDFYSAAQIAYFNGDTTKFLAYLQKAFNAGMTFVCLEKAPIFKTIFMNPLLLEQLKSQYAKRKLIPIDKAIRDSVMLRFHTMELAKDEWANDASKKDDFDALESCNTNYYISFLQNGIFPSEQLIGPFTDDNFADFLARYNQKRRLSVAEKMGGAFTAGKPFPEDYELWNSNAYVSFLHYPCAFERTKDLFWKAVENGYLHPKDIGMLEEWSAKNFGSSSNVNDCSLTKQECYYNIYSGTKVTSPMLVAQVEENRKAKHMQSYSVDLLKKQLESEKGFAFFFGFMHHR